MIPSQIIDECKRFHDCITADIQPEDQLLVALALRYHFSNIADTHNKITATWEPDTESEPDIAEGPEQLADARLIAAAPELLEACKAILSRAVPTAVVYGLLKNAIAKAEGGAK